MTGKLSWKTYGIIFILLIIFANAMRQAEIEDGSKNLAVELVDYKVTSLFGARIFIEGMVLTNHGKHDAKDVEINCTFYGSSGTKLDSDREVFYVRIAAGQTLPLNLGLDNPLGSNASQVDKAFCNVTNFIEI